MTNMIRVVWLLTLLSSCTTLQPAYAFEQPSIEQPSIESRVEKIIDGYGYPDSKTLTEIIMRESVKNKIAPFLIVSVIAIESNFDTRAKSKAGAIGLMQVKPNTATEVLAEDFTKRKWRLFRPEVNVAAGTAYLAWCLKITKGNRAAALEIYNNGRQGIRLARAKGELKHRYSEKVLLAYRTMKKTRKG